MELSPQQREVLLETAREVIRDTLAGEESASSVDPPDITDPALLQPAGCFVSLHDLRSHRLRGCVGRIDATTPLLDALRSAAVSVLNDPRFTEMPVTLAELPDLELEVSVLSPLRAAPDPLAFNPLNDGIYLVYRQRAGCFLPQVARETGWGRERLLERLCTEKMGLPPETWRDPAATLYLFSTLLIGPEPFVPRHSIAQPVPHP